MASIVVSNRSVSQINPFVYGNFMEFIERHISGMWAEMIENRRMEDRVEGKSTPEFWRPYIYNNAAFFAIDRNCAHGTGCQRIECAQDDGGYCGILQAGIGVTKGRAYTGHVYLRQVDLEGGVEIAVGRDYGVFFQAYAAARIEGVSGEWAKYAFSLTPDNDDDEAELVIRFAGRGTLWIDHPSLMPADNMDGWRRDVVDCVKQLRPNIIRFPGGCYADIYHWQNAIGERDKRSPQSNYFWSDVPLDYRISDRRTGRHWRPTEPNDVGIDEFMRLCELTDTEPLICVNLGTGTAEEAAAWIRYCNDPADSPYGKMRAANGHPAPYGIRYWQIGNEMFGAHEIGYSGLDGYIAGYKRFHAAMKAADPNIRFLIDGYDGPWNRAILKECAGLFEFIDIHYYPHWEIETDANPLSGVFEHFFARLAGVEAQIDELRRDIEEAGLTGKVKVAVCEYSITGGGWGTTRAYIGTQAVALFVAGIVRLMVKNADLVQIGNFSNLTNAWWSSAIRTRREKIHATAAFHVLSMFSNLAGGELIESALSCDALDVSQFRRLDRDAPTEEGRVHMQRMSVASIPAQDAVATYDRANKRVVIAAINKTNRDAELSIELRGYAATGPIEISYTWAPEMHWLNDFHMPARIAPIREALEAGEMSVRLKPCSMTFIGIPVEG